MNHVTWTKFRQCIYFFVKNDVVYTVSQEFPDSIKNLLLLLKNLQFLPDHYEILTKEGTHEDLILTKFRNCGFFDKSIFFAESRFAWVTLHTIVVEPF